MNQTKETDTQPILHSLPEAQSRLRISRSKLFELIKDRRIRVLKLDKRTLVPEAEIQRFVESLMSAAA